MPFIAAIVIATVALCYGAYKIAARSTVWPVVLGPLMMIAGWRVLLASNIPQGEGAAIGVVVMQGGSWYVGGVCVLLAVVLLGTSFYVNRSKAAAAVLLLFVAPAVITLAYQLTSAGGAGSTAGSAPHVDSAAQRRNSYVEGAVWADDNGIVADSACHGNPAFIEGCKHAVHLHH